MGAAGPAKLQATCRDGERLRCRYSMRACYLCRPVPPPLGAERAARNPRGGARQQKPPRIRPDRAIHDSHGTTHVRRHIRILLAVLSGSWKGQPVDGADASVAKSACVAGQRVGTGVIRVGWRGLLATSDSGVAARQRASPGGKPTGMVEPALCGNLVRAARLFAHFCLQCCWGCGHQLCISHRPSRQRGRLRCYLWSTGRRYGGVSTRYLPAGAAGAWCPHSSLVFGALARCVGQLGALGRSRDWLRCCQHAWTTEGALS
mmetsp:Transcript_8266/g.14909  ORF Transcript_8266/g.14909 Transcript_8266/m.14909 type:complete len:261 (+) Transcript_8266:575-1357(+)